MSIGPLDDETVDKHRKAGEVLRTVMDEAAEMVEPGVTHLEVAEYAESRINELADGCAFPANISINEEASHATPAKDDATVFTEDDMVCLDLGVHVDGYIADTATRVDLSADGRWTPLLRRIAWLLALAIPAGNIFIPVAVLAGIYF